MYTSKHARPRQREKSEQKKKIHDFLKNNSVGVLSTVDPNNDPHGAVVYYGIDDGFNIGFITKRDTKKNDNLRHNNRIVFVVFDPRSQTTVQILGFAEDVSNDLDVNSIFHDMLKAAYATSESKLPPISKLPAGPYVAYRINPTQIRMTTYLKSGKGGYEVLEVLDF